jgi:hypothetical protein
MAKKIEDQIVTIPAGNTEEAMIQAQQEIDTAVEKEVKENKDLTETAAHEEAIAKVNVEQSGYSLGDIANSTYISTDVTSPSHHNDVKFEVTHPKETSLQKGVTVVSKEVAEHFEKLGLGKIVK